MRRKLIALFLFFVTAVYAEARRIHRNETFHARATPQENQSIVATFVPLDPRQIQRAEITIERFLAKLTGSVARSIALRLSSPNESSQKMIREIGEIVRAKVAEFARGCGLTASMYGRYERARYSTALSEDWFSESLAQGSLLLRDLVSLGEEIRLTVDRYLDTYNITLRYDELFQESSPREAVSSFKFFSAINDPSGFNERLFRCLQSASDRRKGASSFDFNRVLGNLLEDSPSSAVSAFKAGLDRAFLRYAPNNDTSSKQLYALLCHSLVERVSHRGDCIKQLRRLEVCALSAERSDVVVGHIFRIKPWLLAIEDLSDCKIYVDVDGSASARCDLDRRVPRTTVRRVRYVYEKILGRRIFRRSLLHQVASELGNALSQSRWGRQFAYDVCRYFAIYQKGIGRLNEFSKNVARNKKAATRYKRISESLNLYKNGILRKMMLAIGNFHRSMLEMQKFLIYGVRSSFVQTRQYYLEILACFAKWMTKLLELFGCTKLDDTDVDVSIIANISPINETDSASVIISDDTSERDEVTYDRKIKRQTDEAFERLMQSMNRVSSVRSWNDGSAIACFSNNLLLVAMFMETIGLVSTLFCLGSHKNEFNSDELKEEWVPPERDRRSLFSTDFAEIDTISKNFN